MKKLMCSLLALCFSFGAYNTALAEWKPIKWEFSQAQQETVLAYFPGGTDAKMIAADCANLGIETAEGCVARIVGAVHEAKQRYLAERRVKLLQRSEVGPAQSFHCGWVYKKGWDGDVPVCKD